MTVTWLRTVTCALAILLATTFAAIGAERVSFTGKLESAVCPTACGACCGSYLLRDSAEQINVYVGNSFVDLRELNEKGTLHRIGGSFYKTTGQCGSNQCTLFLVEEIDQVEGAVTVYDPQTETLEVPIATIAESKDLFAVMLKAPFVIESLTPLGSVKRAIQGQGCGTAEAQCATGLSCESYYGIAGASGPQFQTCEIPCSQPGALCPLGQACVTVADGPGQVCQALP